MKRFIVLICLLFACHLLFAEEVLYQKQHKNLDSIDVVTLIKSADDWFCISIVIAEDEDAIEKFFIYDSSLERIQDLLFLFEKEKQYKERIGRMEKAETLLFLKEETEIKEGHIIRTKHYMYMK